MRTAPRSTEPESRPPASWAPVSWASLRSYAPEGAPCCAAWCGGTGAACGAAASSGAYPWGGTAASAGAGVRAAAAACSAGAPSAVCGNGTATGGDGATPGCGSVQAPWAPGISSRSSSSAVPSAGSRKAYAPGAGIPGCSTRPSFSGSPSAGTWPVSVMRTPRPSVVLLQSSARQHVTSGRAARHEQHADVQHSRRVRPSWQRARATIGCGLRHVAHPPVALSPMVPQKGALLRILNEGPPGCWREPPHVRLRWNGRPAYLPFRSGGVTGRVCGARGLRAGARR